MARIYEIGDRISFKNLSSPSKLCTVRYIGEVDGFRGQWLGIEWDDDSRGKHDGCVSGKKYFSCLSPSSTAASFVRSSRPADQEQSFIEAIYNKYALGITNPSFSTPIYKEVIISGKVAQEIGFEKVRETQAQLYNLKIVILDDMKISVAQRENESIKDFCPNIVELDLSRNLFRHFEDIRFIYSNLHKIQRLRLNGNRFSDIESLHSKTNFSRKDCSTGITKLELDEVLLPWDSLVILRSYFPFLTNLTASSNHIRSLTRPLMDGLLVSLTLEYNNMECLSDLSPLINSKSLKTLLLKGNKITRISNLSTEMTSRLKFGVNLKYVDLSYNNINSWSFVDDISTVFPGLTGLRISSNPLYPAQSLDTKISEYEENFLITIGRVKNLKTLNFSDVTTAERNNAEIYYLAKIGQELSEIPEDQIDSVIFRHKRYHELCRKWGAPSLNRKTAEDYNQNTIENRLISFTFEFVCPHKEIRKETLICRQIPKSIDVYRVKALVGKMFGVCMFDLRLIWETGEWDPVAGYEDEELETTDDDIAIKHLDLLSKDEKSTREKGGIGWVKREVEIEDSTRQIGSYIEGFHATVRVEYVPVKSSE